MSEAPSIRGLLLGHGDMPAGMADAVRQITGVGEDVLMPLSNRGRSPESLADSVREHAGDQLAFALCLREHVDFYDR